MMDAILAAVLAVLIYAVLDTAFPDEPIQNPEHHVQEIEQAELGRE